MKHLPHPKLDVRSVDEFKERMDAIHRAVRRAKLHRRALRKAR